jgi:hypothetical protein
VFQTLCDDTLLNDILNFYPKIVVANLLFLSIDVIISIKLSAFSAIQIR